jgi:hypothetical protein
VKSAGNARKAHRQMRMYARSLVKCKKKFQENSGAKQFSQPIGR